MANHQYTVFENDTKSLFFKSWRAKQATFISKQPNLTLLSELWIIDPVELGAREPRLGFFYLSCEKFKYLAIVDRKVLFLPWFSMLIFSSLNTLCNRSNEFWADDNGLVIKFGISLKTTQVDFMAVLHSIFWSSNDIAADQKFFGI